MEIPREAEHMELVEAQLLSALSDSERPMGGLELSLATRVRVDDAYPALHRLVRGGYVDEVNRFYKLTPAGSRVARSLTR
jgi:DNA-binding PadR family transcriptional regulator